MNRYLVVSYDPDQQQWFYDVVFARDEEKAKGQVCHLRPYVIDADATSMPDLERMTRKVQEVDQAENELWLRSVAEESGVRYAATR